MRKKTSELGTKDQMSMKLDRENFISELEILKRLAEFVKFPPDGSTIDWKVALERHERVMKESVGLFRPVPDHK